VNPAAQRIFGYTERELYGQAILKLMPESPEARKGEVDVRCKNGATVHMKFDAARSDSPGREIYLFFQIPSGAPGRPSAATAAVSEIPHEEHARPSLTAIEGVVNRIVRQFEGLLTTINGYTELALNGAPEGSPIRRDLEEIAAASDTASNLSRNLLAFTGNQTIPTEVVDLNSLLGALDSGIREAAKGRVLIEQSSERAPVVGNAACLRDVVLLLARSAQHRSNGDGSIRVKSGRMLLDEPKPVYTGKLPAAEYCYLSVSDSGPALTSSALEHLFEPLFLDSDSIGVELAPIYGIVRSLGGWIDITPGVPTGNTFEVFLPYSGDAQVGESAKKALAS
jgi:PAS domain S-box-containing protein